MQVEVSRADQAHAVVAEAILAFGRIGVLASSTDLSVRSRFRATSESCGILLSTLHDRENV